MQKERQVSGNCSSDYPLCEAQSEKASIEFTSLPVGVLKEVLVEGEVAKVGEPVGLIEVKRLTPPRQPPRRSTRTTSGHPLSIRSATTLLKEAPPSPPTPRCHFPLGPDRPAEHARLDSDDALAVPYVRHFAMMNGISDYPSLYLAVGGMAGSKCPM